MKTGRKLCRTGILFLAAVSALCLLFSACAGSPGAKTAPQISELVIVHTNDHHGTLFPENDGAGGLAPRMTFLRKVRAEHKNVLLLDAGDLNTSGAVSNLFLAAPDIAGYTLAGYDAVAFGNHEFDRSLDTLTEQMDQAGFEWLSANVVFADSGKPLGLPYLVRDFGSFRAGVLGLTTRRTVTADSPDKRLRFTDEIRAAQETVALLREKERCGVVIVLAHLGIVEEEPGQTTSVLLAENLSGVDLIVDGHSHTVFAEPLVVNGIPIVSAGEKGKLAGLGILEIRDGYAADFRWNAVEISADVFPPDGEMDALLAPYAEAAAETLQQVVMTAASEFEFGDRLPRRQETAIGNLICDAQIWFARQLGLPVDFALCNGGNIRAALPAGAVTRENFLTALPFENPLYMVRMSGEDVAALFAFLGTVPQGSGAFPQVSAEVQLTLSFDGEGKPAGVSGVTVHGVPVDPERDYWIAVNGYLALGGDGYSVFTRSLETVNTFTGVNDAVLQYAAQLPQPVRPETDGRMLIRMQ